MAHPLQEAYMQVPLITRSYATACLLTTLACQLEVVSPFHLYFNLDLIVKEYQFWRLITNFLYFGNLGLDFIFHMFFLVRYSRMLEESSFRGRTADYFFLLLFGSTLMMVVALFHNVFFFGSSLTFMLVYIWGRRNPHVRMGFLSLFYFRAPFLPWVLLGISMLLGHNVTADVIGIAVGHLYYFLEDIYPAPVPSGGLGGPQLLRTPGFITMLFRDGLAQDPNYQPPPEERPGGFAWGGEAEEDDGGGGADGNPADDGHEHAD